MVAETGHTITTSEGKIIHKKLASKPLNFPPLTSRKPEDQRKPTNRCRRCGKFSSGELCETHLRLETTRQDDNNNEPSTSHTTMPTMPAKKKRSYNRVVMYNSSSHGSESTSQYADNDTSEEEDVTEDATLKEAIDREVERLRSQTPMLTSPFRLQHRNTPDHRRNTTGRIRNAESRPKHAQRRSNRPRPHR